MNNLIILGNGFDLAHGMETLYGDFITWMIDEHLKDRTKFKKLLNISETIDNVESLFALVEASHTSAIWVNILNVYDVQDFVSSFVKKTY